MNVIKTFEECLAYKWNSHFWKLWFVGKPTLRSHRWKTFTRWFQGILGRRKETWDPGANGPQTEELVQTNCSATPQSVWFSRAGVGAPKCVMWYCLPEEHILRTTVSGEWEEEADLVFKSSSLRREKFRRTGQDRLCSTHSCPWVGGWREKGDPSKGMKQTVAEVGANTPETQQWTLRGKMVTTQGKS